MRRNRLSFSAVAPSQVADYAERSVPDTSQPHPDPGDSGADVGRRWLRSDNILLVAALALFVWFTGDVLLLVFAGLQILMGTVFGIMGLIMAAPLTLAAMVMVKKLYVEDMLGEPQSSP
jgi:hypothetical protein